MPNRKINLLTFVLGVGLLLAVPLVAQDRDPDQAREPGSEKGPAEPDESVEEDEDEEADESPDALRDPFISKVIKPRVWIDKPGFSLETRGKLQVQYYDADSADQLNDDELFIRRLRPYFLGHFGKNWLWKGEIELSADLEAGKIDTSQLDIRDIYVRYEGFKAEGWRLTLGNQKTPFSRDFLTPSPHLLLIERTPVGDTNFGVPDRSLAVHFRGESHGGKVVYWGNVGALGHSPDVQSMKFESLVGASGDINEGGIISGRVDFHPRGDMTFSDGDDHTPTIKYTLSVAGYDWENDGRNNTHTEGGVALDPEKADLDSAWGLELSGGLRGRGITLDGQYNRIEGKTVVGDFTGGIYANGEARIDVAAVEGGYRLPRSVVELGGAISRADADAYTTPRDQWDIILNLHLLKKFSSKVQISHRRIFNRFGMRDQDFDESRIQIQYVW